jgi:hypothetical protein
MPPRTVAVGHKRPRDPTDVHGVEPTEIAEFLTDHVKIAASRLIATYARTDGSDDLERHLLAMMRHPRGSLPWLHAQGTIQSMALNLDAMWNRIRECAYAHVSTISPVMLYTMRTLMELGLQTVLVHTASGVARDLVFMCLGHLLSSDPFLAATHAGPTAETIALGTGYAWPVESGVTPWEDFLALVPERHWNAILFNLVQTATSIANCSQAGKECHAMLICVLSRGVVCHDLFARDVLVRIHATRPCAWEWCYNLVPGHVHIDRDSTHQIPLRDVFRQWSCGCRDTFGCAKEMGASKKALISAVTSAAARAAWRRALLCTLALSRDVPIVALRVLITAYMT